MSRHLDVGTVPLLIFVIVLSRLYRASALKTGQDGPPADRTGQDRIGQAAVDRTWSVGAPETHRSCRKRSSSR